MEQGEVGTRSNHGNHPHWNSPHGVIPHRKSYQFRALSRKSIAYQVCPSPPVAPYCPLLPLNHPHSVIILEGSGYCNMLLWAEDTEVLLLEIQSNPIQKWSEVCLPIWLTADYGFGMGL